MILRKKLEIFCLLIGLSAILHSCAKAPVNFDIEQQWLLEKFTILETEETIECERLYYCITYMVTSVVEKQGPNNYGAFIARTEYRGDAPLLVFKDFKLRWETGDSGIDATAEQLKPFGINNPKETIFRILKNEANQLVLESNYARLYLKCF